MNDFKVGDRVEYVGADSIVRNPLLMGSIGCVSHSGDASVMVSWDDPGKPRHGVLVTNLRHITPDVITINRAEDAPAFALDALELHGVPPTDTGGWRTAMEQSFQSTSDADLVYTAWLHLKALSLRTARKQAAAEAVAAEKEAAEKLAKRRDGVAKEVAKRACYVNYQNFTYEDHVPAAQAAINMFIELEDPRG